ncbi:MAG: acyl--CoA ligase, partial [Ruminococcaceae bacterium]|nr:acyl--CoA ligase [Oscillospiraceae bacterium]
MNPISAKIPWQDALGEIPLHLSYFEGTLSETVFRMTERYPGRIAYEFLGRRTTYAEMRRQILAYAASLQALGIGAGDCVTIALPNCPQAVCLFYAVNLAGGVANMIHPLSARREIAFYLKESGSTVAVTLDEFAEKFSAIRQETGLQHLILARIRDELPPLKAVGYALKEGRKTPSRSADVLAWRDFLRLGKHHAFTPAPRSGEESAVILYSGGTTGTTKGILLTNRNFNALGQQVIAANPMFTPGDRMLAAMPMFHGFGLGVCIHAMLSHGGCAVLVPRFTPRSYAALLVRRRCAFVAGVPTLYEALLRQDAMAGADLSFLKGVFSGGDSLSPELKKKLDAFLAAHHAPVSVREGYGTTETVT